MEERYRMVSLDDVSAGRNVGIPFAAVLPKLPLAANPNVSLVR
jgi:hypothetical protein